MAFLGLPISQIDGSRFQYANCGPAVTSELGQLSSVGALLIPPAKIRLASGDVSGGIEGSVLARTWNNLTANKYPFFSLKVGSREEMNNLLETHSLGLIINCRVTVNTKYRTNAFTGLHWVTVAAGTLKDGTYKVEDPGTTSAGWLRWPRSLLFDAAEAVGAFWVLRGVQTEDVDKKAVVAGAAVRAKPDRSAKAVKRLTLGEKVHVKRTTKGGPWRRADGTNAHGWHQIGAGYVKGEDLR